MFVNKTYRFSSAAPFHGFNDVKLNGAAVESRVSLTSCQKNKQNKNKNKTDKTQ